MSVLTAQKSYTSDMRLSIDNVPKDTKRKFKALCAENEKTMSEIIIQFMERCIEAGKL